MPGGPSALQCALYAPSPLAHAGASAGPLWNSQTAPQWTLMHCTIGLPASTQRSVMSTAGQAEISQFALMANLDSFDAPFQL